MPSNLVLSTAVPPCTVLLTGATGFVGSHLMTHLKAFPQIFLRVSSRSNIQESSKGHLEVLPPSDLTADVDWTSALEGCDVVIHTAARVHVMHETAADPLTEFRRVNVDGTLNLARQAAEKGVKRFIFLSSVKVNGEATFNQNKFLASDMPSPEDAYGISKFEAEQSLLVLAKKTGMEVVIIRPPLVYGPGVKGNLNRVISWVNKGWPMPFGLIHNKRSFVSVYNLISLILCCIDHPNAVNQIFLVSDGQDISTPDLLKVVGRAVNKPLRLLPFPVVILQLLSTLVGRKSDFDRLNGSLQLDITKTCEQLGWEPIACMQDTLTSMISGLKVNH